MVVKNINLLNKKGYIVENIYIAMNLKERGITVGDLLIILIIILITTILYRTYSKEKKSTLYYNSQETISYKIPSLSRINI